MKEFLKKIDINTIEKFYIEQGLEHMQKNVMKTKKYNSSIQYTITLNEELYLLLKALALKNKTTISKIIYLLLQDQFMENFMPQLDYATELLKVSKENKSSDIEYLE